jgi:hypothetical protein
VAGPKPDDTIGRHGSRFFFLFLLPAAFFPFATNFHLEPNADILAATCHCMYIPFLLGLAARSIAVTAIGQVRGRWAILGCERPVA